MVSLLVISLVLSAPATAAQSASASQGPQPAPTPYIAQDQAKVSSPLDGEPSLDQNRMHPGSGICYKIRAYIFSTGPSPRFLRETTCPQVSPGTKQTHGHIEYLQLKDNPAASPQK